ncbi:MAG: restriction endonuclease [Candidatus Nanopelagicales bacterium]|nr:restriction endonuclease [Candidatus Nanopelagicales bacterium]
MSPRVPKYQELLWPVVEALRALGGSGSISEIDTQVAAQQGFSEELQSVSHLDGPNSEVGYRSAWARSYLKKMGLATNTGRGVWALTPRGRNVTADEIEPLRRECLKDLREARAAVAEEAGPDEGSSDVDVAWQDDLLKAVLDLDPTAFERLCQRLLREAGFSRTQVTGKTGDGGIDGLGVYRVSLVSFQVFFQAKRWRNSVGAKEVRDFRGAMAGRGEKGLLITTSTFTADAKAEASRDGAPPVDLVDGTTLCDLLVEHRIGVTVQERMVRDIAVDVEALGSI